MLELLQDSWTPALARPARTPERPVRFPFPPATDDGRDRGDTRGLDRCTHRSLALFSRAVDRARPNALRASTKDCRPPPRSFSSDWPWTPSTSSSVLKKFYPLEALIVSRRARRRALLHHSWTGRESRALVAVPARSRSPEPRTDEGHEHIAISPTDDISVELSSRRTGMSFHRTRMSADRTLMSIIRTSLSLISFGFTIFQFFQKLVENNIVSTAHSTRAFGLTLVWIGIGMLALGILFHVQFMIGLRHERSKMKEEGLIHAESHFPVSLTLLTAVALLILGVAAIVSMTFRTGPFG